MFRTSYVHHDFKVIYFVCKKDFFSQIQKYPSPILTTVHRIHKTTKSLFLVSTVCKCFMKVITEENLRINWPVDMALIFLFMTKFKLQYNHHFILVKLNVGLLWLKLYSKRRGLFFFGKLGLELRKKLVKCYICSIALCGAETGTFRAVDQKQLESFEMWRWIRVEKISWTDRVRNGEVLPRVNEQRNILHEISKRKANWIGHILRRNCLL